MTREIAERAVNCASILRCDYADVRIVQREAESISVKNGVPEGIKHDRDQGLGIRVLCNGAWGFAASADLSLASAETTAALAVRIAQASSRLQGKGVEQALASPVVATWQNDVKVDPFSVPLEQKLGLLVQCAESVEGFKSVKLFRGSMDFRRTRQLFLNTEGGRIDQTIVITGAGIEATAMGEDDVQQRSYPSSFRGHWAAAGYELVESLDLFSNASRIAEEATMLLTAKPCPHMETDLILDADQLALQLHESIGHPLELDRILGMELSYAGGSFVSLDDLGKLVYGSPLLNVYADATLEAGLGSFGYDDEGVVAQRVALIEEGVLRGFLSNRETAAVLGIPSGGAARASDWRRIPLVRMTNICLLPHEGTLEELIADTKEGILMATNRSWSIDDLRLNFQFGCEIAWEIKNGKLGEMFKNPTYTGVTPQFWASLDRVAGPTEVRSWGTPTCGKGQPPQVIPVGHFCPPARFRNVQVGAAS